jgi:hypothetical protein
VNAQAAATPVSAAAPPYEVRAIDGGQGVFATRAISAGTRLFGEDDWADEEERKRFSTLSPDQVRGLTVLMRPLFLRFAYNSGPDRISGTFHPESVRHPVNFLNHSCDPNAGYDGADHIVALVRIAAGEQIRMDYGTYTFSFDHDFTCRCGALRCRGKVTSNDWPDLVRAGLRLPGFMRKEAAKALWG